MTTAFIQSKLLDSVDGIRHGFTGRKGGVSTGLFDSLNMSQFSSDSKAHVEDNRARVVDALGAKNLVTNHQVHGRAVRVVDAESDLESVADADGLVTRERGIAIGALGADCAPVVFADPENGVIGVAHAGWQGAVSGVTDAVIDQMLVLGAELNNIRSAIGPAIAPESYEVGDEFREKVRDLSVIDVEAFFLFPDPADNVHFDLPGYIQAKLLQRGLQHVDCQRLDTYADEERFFSYRRCCHRKEADYGRQAGVIVLR